MVKQWQIIKNQTLIGMPKFNAQEYFEQHLDVLPASDAAHKTVVEIIQRKIITDFKYDGKRETWHVQVFGSVLVFRCFEGLARAFEYQYTDERIIDAIWIENEDIINHIFNQ